MNTTESFFAPCPRGLEDVLAAELQALGVGTVKAVRGGAEFSGPYSICHTVNLESRIASRVLWQVSRAQYENEQDIYEGARRVSWSDFFSSNRSIRVDVSAIKSPVRSLDFVTLRVKDAVCDAFRAIGSQRPDVDTRRPDVRVHAFLTASDCTLYIDTSGEALFKRGYRTDGGRAPLRENLAAGILRLIGWRGDARLFDPMCGSGTFLTEAAMLAGNIAPGAKRRFAFEKLVSHDPRMWQAQRDAARARPQKIPVATIFGSDVSGQAIDAARANLQAIGAASAVDLKQRDVLEVVPPGESGVIVSNPPYGVRMDEQQGLAEFYPRLGDALKKRFGGWNAYLFTADLRLAKLIRLSASKRIPLFNGALDCRLFEYKLVEGSNRKARSQ